MHEIEQKINLFLEQVCDGKAAFSEELVQEFGERCKDILRKGFVEKTTENKTFYLRMSNIGRSLRQLMLSKANGGAWQPTKEFKLKSTIGHLYEAFFLALLKQSGVNVVDQDKRVELTIDDTIIQGTYDVKIDGKIYDIKTASPYAYEYKFASAEALKNGDSFGYYAQLFGYSIADKAPAGGWIALNKVTGEFKVVEIPKYEHDKISEEYKKEITDKVRYIKTSDVIPPCCGVVDEYFFKKKTGNKILSRECEYCDYKTSTCHKGNLTVLPDVNSKSKEPKLRYYIGKVLRPNAVKS